MLIFVPFEVNVQLALVWKYGCMRKDNELIKKNTFYLANSDSFCFILHHIKIIMYQYIMWLCVMLCYHHEFHITYYYVCKGDFFFQSYMDKTLSHFWVYGYYNLVKCIKNTNVLFTHGAWTIHFISSIFDAWQIDGCI